MEALLLRMRVQYMPFRLISSQNGSRLPLSMEEDEQDQVLRQDHPDRGLIIDLLWSFFDSFFLFPVKRLPSLEALC